MKKILRPSDSEYALYYGRYIDTVPPGTHVLEELKNNMKTFTTFLQAIPEDKLLYRYAEGKWSIKDIVQHMIDVERVFVYRAMRFSRNDKMPLAFFDEDEYARQADADHLNWNKLCKEYKTLRMSTIAFFNNQNTKTMKRSGIAGQSVMSVRACAWIIYAHEMHHWKVIREKYLGESPTN